MVSGKKEGGGGLERSQDDVNMGTKLKNYHQPLREELDSDPRKPTQPKTQNKVDP